MRTYSGRILLRIPPEIHEQLAREAFESGRSINQLCIEALLARKVLKDYDPWKSIEELWDKNRRVSLAELTAEIKAAIRETRRAR